MNIVKFSDIILNEQNSAELTQEERDLFNTKFKGKYAYCVNWIYVIALEDITYQEYIDNLLEIIKEILYHIWVTL